MVEIPAGDEDVLPPAVVKERFQDVGENHVQVLPVVPRAPVRLIRMGEVEEEDAARAEHAGPIVQCTHPVGKMLEAM